MYPRLSRVWVTLVAVAILGGAPAGGAAVDPQNPPQGRFSDDWMEIHLSGKKVGYAHSSMTRDGDLIHSSTTTEMHLGRVDQPVKLKIVENAVETLAGRPRSFETVQDLSIQKLSMKGTFKDDSVTIVSTQFGMSRTEDYKVPADALLKSWGSFRESLLRGFKPGTEYTLSIYEPGLRLDAPVSALTKVGNWEEFEHHGKTMRGQRVTAVMTTPMGAMELISWVDQDGTPIKAKVPAPGIGDLEMVITDQATALAEFVPPELFMTTVVKAKRSLNPKGTRRVVYRVSSKNGDAALGDIPDTGMQTVSEQTATSALVTVTRLRREPPAGASPAASIHPSPATAPRELAEYLEGNLMMNTADPELAELARKAGGGEKNLYILGDKLRRFVSEYVTTKSLNIGFATASEVCRTREGDCSEHGVLLAALGRLNGLPSRVAVGLAYVPLFGKQDDIFGYHLWTQFLIDGRWVDFDAALGESDCSPTRIAFAVSSLKSSGIADLSLPLLSKIGAIDIDIVDVEPLPSSDAARSEK
ncbi:MAG: transglutaminase domain-containing protein [Planctomycetes bacterium]|nr:transglutaminase domain-containing protein [Planctomycetota bacterium]